MGDVEVGATRHVDTTRRHDTSTRHVDTTRRHDTSTRHVDTTRRGDTPRLACREHVDRSRRVAVHIMTLMSWASLDFHQRNLLVGVALLFTGCAAMPPEKSLPLLEVERFSESGVLAVEQRWWESFDEPALNLQVERALGENFNLMAAWQQLQAARALVEATRADRFVQLDAFGEAEVENEAGGDSDRSEDLYALGLQASYEVDLWGRIDALVDADRLRAEAVYFDYQAAALSLGAEVTRVWLNLSEARLQLRLLERQIQTNRDILELLEARLRAAQISSADVLRQRRLVEATREQFLIASSRAEVLEHLLAVLTGQPAQEAATEAVVVQLPAVPSLPDTGLPADLLLRRPDVRSALADLQSANAELAAAVRDQYPRVDLAASLRTAAENPSELFEQWITSLAGQVVAPILDGGRRRAVVRRNEAISQQRLALYGQRVVEAFAEVEDALTISQYQARRIESIETQLELTEQTLERLRLQYLNGVVDYISVLTALTEQQRLERALLTSQVEMLNSRVDLYRALAGPFETPAESMQAAATRPQADITDE